MLPSEPAGLADRPEAANLVGIYAAVERRTTEEVLAEYGGRGFGDFKPALAELAIETLSPVTDEMKRLMHDPENIDRILAEGAARARAISEPILRQINEIIGFIAAK